MPNFKKNTSAFMMKGFSGFGNEKKKEARKRRKNERKESRAHDKSARKAYREDHPGVLNRLLGKYKIK
tara:strand:+ start:218 stop:421 length:204 start_codon:yes stop_codon:yes gene_type:complete